MSDSVTKDLEEVRAWLKDNLFWLQEFKPDFPDETDKYVALNTAALAALDDAERWRAVRRDENPARGILIGLALALPLWLMIGCALWELGTQVRPKHLRPCVGTYAYPDSAGTCEPKEGE